MQEHYLGLQYSEIKSDSEYFILGGRVLKKNHLWVLIKGTISDGILALRFSPN